MNFYVDTSVIVAALVEEPRSGDMEYWLANQAPATVFISEWTMTEVSSALSLKQRTNQIDGQERQRALFRLGVLAREVFTVLAVQSRHFVLARQFLDDPASSLRSGDALHLAIARDNGLVFCTLDRRCIEDSTVTKDTVRLL